MMSCPFPALSPGAPFPPFTVLYCLPGGPLMVLDLLVAAPSFLRLPLPFMLLWRVNFLLNLFTAFCYLKIARCLTVF